MTPSEKKASENDPILEELMLHASDYAGCGCCSGMGTDTFQEKAKIALSEAERRGFERAKKIVTDQLKGIDACDLTSSEQIILNQLENLKYEEA